MRAIQIERYGGPEVLVPIEMESPSPGPGEVVVAVAAAGVNFVDVYFRTGRYPTQLPFTPGVEGAGTVIAIGADVTGLDVGDRVGWVQVQGAYAARAAIPADRTVPLPDGIDVETAAAVLLQGMTAHYLVRDTYRIRPGDTVLIHAAAGGMGLLLTQLVTQLGGRAIATVSTAAKEELARAAGAADVIRYTEADVKEQVRRLTGSAGVSVVYDGVGTDTFDASLASLRPRGTLVLFGAASGPVPPVDPMRLERCGSLFLTRPSLTHHITDRAELLSRATDVLRWVADGTLSVRIGGRYPLREAARAHADLESRRTTGKLLLLP
jgi:NADPH2:quinone reductase